METNTDTVITAASTGLASAATGLSLQLSGQNNAASSQEDSGDTVSISSQGLALYQSTRPASSSDDTSSSSSSTAASATENSRTTIIKNQIEAIQKKLDELDRSNLTDEEKENQRMALQQQLLQLTAEQAKLTSGGTSGSTRTPGGSGGAPAEGFANSLT